MKLNQLVFCGTGIKKPLPVKIYQFQGSRNIKTQEGIAYQVDGIAHYLLEDLDGNQWPIKKSIFEKTYIFQEKIK